MDKVMLNITVRYKVILNYDQHNKEEFFNTIIEANKYIYTHINDNLFLLAEVYLDKVYNNTEELLYMITEDQRIYINK